MGKKKELSKTNVSKLHVRTKNTVSNSVLETQWYIVCNTVLFKKLYSQHVYIYKCIMHIVILKDKLFYVQENSKGFIKKKQHKKWKK
jgi:hypothetical protein